jgi:hypothetical protein
MDDLKKNLWVSFFSLFTSMSTLICCALPALLVSIGLGATMIGLVSTFPSLIWLSENKALVFTLSFFKLSISFRNAELIKQKIRINHQLANHIYKEMLKDTSNYQGYHFISMF